MDDLTTVIVAASVLIVLAVVAYVAYKRLKKLPENILMELSGEMRLNYYPSVEGKPPFATGTYSQRGVTFDMLNEKGYFDRWHLHSRIVVSVDKNIKDTHIVANRGRFYSRKLGEVKVNNKRFEEKYVFLSSTTTKAERLLSDNVVSWILNLDMPFILSDGHVIFHQDQPFVNKERIRHLADALVYIAATAEKTK